MKVASCITLLVPLWLGCFYYQFCQFTRFVVGKHMLTLRSTSASRSNWRSTVRARSWRKAGSWCVNTQREATGWCRWSHRRPSADNSSSSATTTSPATDGSRWSVWRTHFTWAPNPKSLSVITLPSRSYGEHVCDKSDERAKTLWFV